MVRSSVSLSIHLRHRFEINYSPIEGIISSCEAEVKESAMITFRTTDLWFTAFLLTRGAFISRVDSNGRGRRVFVCDGDPEKIQDASAEYYGGSARVEPKAFRHAVTDVRAMISTRASKSTQEQTDGASSGAGIDC